MPDGKTHRNASLLMAAGFTAGTVVLRDPHGIEYALGALVGTILSPDEDIRNHDNKVWNATWGVYRNSIKHGSELSHVPVIGTLGRLAYLFFFAVFLPTLAFSILFHLNMYAEMNWWLSHTLPRWRFVLGLMSSDTHHYIMDVITVNSKFNLGSLLHWKTNYHGGKNDTTKRTNVQKRHRGTGRQNQIANPRQPTDSTNDRPIRPVRD